MGKNESKQNRQENPNQDNLVTVNAPGGVRVQILGMDINVSDLNISIGPETNIGDIYSVIDQLRRIQGN